jgi:hypothetical protein
MSGKDCPQGDPIVAVMFTYSWCGFSIRRASGQVESYTAEGLYKLVGEAEYHRLAGVAARLTGHWHPCKEGQP